jgi:hypothetical protein
MLYEDAMDMYMLYKISPELTCQCDEVHECQQCYEERKQDTKPQASTSDDTDMSMPEWYDFD